MYPSVFYVICQLPFIGYNALLLINEGLYSIDAQGLAPGLTSIYSVLEWVRICFQTSVLWDKYGVIVYYELDNFIHHTPRIFYK